MNLQSNDVKKEGFYKSVFHFLCKAPPEALAKSVLAEVPTQLVEFFTTMKLIPPNSTGPAPNTSEMP